MNEEKKNNEARCRELFLILWDKAVGQPEYDKKEWKEFRDLLKEEGIVV